MSIYFVQHGLSLTKEEDPNRGLSDAGRLEIETISHHLAKIGLRVKNVFHSGKTRALQTAQIFSDQMANGALCEQPGMNPNDPIPPLARTLQAADSLYVGHLPQLAKLIGYLVTGNEEHHVLKFTNGGVACLEQSGSQFHIQWVLTPSVLPH